MSHAFRSTSIRMGLIALLAAPALASAYDGVIDPSGDLLSTFAGGAGRADLDVTNAAVYFDAATNMFKLDAVMAGALIPSATNAYVWGVNLGTGAASFAGSGITGVRFNSVVLLRSNGTGSIGAAALPAGAVTVSGNMISATFSAGMLTSTGFTPQNYTWNLWPRDTTFSGFAAISDFAPDNANFTSTPAVIAVPEPASAALMLLGVAGLAGALRRRQSKEG